MTCDIKKHEWKFGIEEGDWHVSSPSCGPECRFLWGGDKHPARVTLGDEREWTYMPYIPVTVRMATECPAYPVDDDQVPTGPAKPMGGYESGSHYIAHGTRCDCNWWPVIRPSTPESDSAVVKVGEVPPWMTAVPAIQAVGGNGEPIEGLGFAIYRLDSEAGT